MVSLKSTLLAAAALVIGAQADYIIEPSTVPVGTRKAWCDSEIATCPAICLDAAPGSGKPLANTCDYLTLTYGCVCGNGLQPNVSEYSLTLPFFTCQQTQTNCVAACGPTNNVCSGKCREDITCGAQRPTHVSSTSTTTTTGGVSPQTSSPAPTLESSFEGSRPGSAGTHSTSVQTSLALAAIITTLFVAPFLLI